MKKFLRVISQRLVMVSLLILVQIAVIVVMMLQFRQYFLYFNTVCTALSFIVVLVIVNRNTNPAYKIAWIIPILCVPVFGWLLYICFAGNQMTHRSKRKMQHIEHKQREVLPRRASRGIFRTSRRVRRTRAPKACSCPAARRSFPG